MNVFVWIGSALALLIYFPLWKQIRDGKVKQNLLTWALWGTLDAIITATIIVQGGSFLLPVTYSIGSAVTAYFIWRAGDKATWTWFETMVATLTAASMVIWLFSGSKVATIASTVAMLIAGILQLIDAWKKPKEMPILAYSGYFIANCLSTAGGKSWAIEERLYPASAAIFCLLIVALSVRKFWLKPESVNTISN